VEPAGPAGIMRVETPHLDLTHVRSALEQLIAAAERRDEDMVRQRLQLAMEAGWPQGVSVISQSLSATGEA